jgi:hypothetical protein
MTRRPNEWRPVSPDDELAVEGDVELVDTAKSTYYWNPLRGQLRRCCLQGSYSEASCPARPDARLVPTVFAASRAEALAAS